MVSDNQGDLASVRWNLQLRAGISAVGVLYWGFAPLTPQRFSYGDMPLARIAELVMPYGVLFFSMILYIFGCFLARFMQSKWARNYAKSCFSGCCLITIGCLAIELAT